MSTPTKATTFTLSVKTAPTTRFASDFADPDIIKYKGIYYAFGTNSGRANVVTATSRDGVTWTPGPDALPALPVSRDAAGGVAAAWKPGGTWAPSVRIASDGSFLMWTAAQNAETHSECIFLARSTSGILGPYAAVDAAKPIVCAPAQDAIDADVVNYNGQPYLVWVAGGGGLTNHIYMQQLQNATVLVGPLITLATDSATIEGPFIFQAGPQWVMFYAQGNYKGANYETRVAVTDDLARGFDLSASVSVARTVAGRVFGPGEPSPVHNVDGFPLNDKGKFLSRNGGQLTLFTNNGHYEGTTYVRDLASFQVQVTYAGMTLPSNRR